MTYQCTRCYDEGFDFGPRATQVACSCEAGKRWADRRSPNRAVQDAATRAMLADRAGIDAEGKVRRFWFDRTPNWKSREAAVATTWVRSESGHYGVIGGQGEPGDVYPYCLLDVSDEWTTVCFVGPFDPDRPDLDPPEVRRPA